MISSRPHAPPLASYFPVVVFAAVCNKTLGNSSVKSILTRIPLCAGKSTSLPFPRRCKRRRRPSPIIVPRVTAPNNTPTTVPPVVPDTNGHHIALDVVLLLQNGAFNGLHILALLSRFRAAAVNRKNAHLRGE